MDVPLVTKFGSDATLLFIKKTKTYNLFWTFLAQQILYAHMCVHMHMDTFYPRVMKLW